jgi:hypothetical protein
VVDLDTVALPVGEENPHGNAWTLRETVLEREATAQRGSDFHAARCWRIESSEARNALGRPTAFRLEAKNPLPVFSAPTASVTRRAGFMTRQLWVTAQDSEELYAAGRYPNQSAGGDGYVTLTCASCKAGFYTPGAAITLQLESRFSSDTAARLRAMGHAVRTVGPYAIGSIQAVLQSQYGTRLAGSDPRRMGYAVGY